MDQYVAAVLERVPWGQGSPPGDPGQAVADVVAALRGIGVQFAPEPIPEQDEVTEQDIDETLLWLAQTAGNVRYLPGGRGPQAILGSHDRLDTVLGEARQRAQGDPETQAAIRRAATILRPRVRPLPGAEELWHQPATAGWAEPGAAAGPQ